MQGHAATYPGGPSLGLLFPLPHFSGQGLPRRYQKLLPPVVSGSSHSPNWIMIQPQMPIIHAEASLNAPSLHSSLQEFHAFIQNRSIIRKHPETMPIHFRSEQRAHPCEQLWAWDCLGLLGLLGSISPGSWENWSIKPAPVVSCSGVTRVGCPLPLAFIQLGVLDKQKHDWMILIDLIDIDWYWLTVPFSSFSPWLLSELPPTQTPPPPRLRGFFEGFVQLLHDQSLVDGQAPARDQWWWSVTPPATDPRASLHQQMDLVNWAVGRPT